jgi:hypothetical protein
MRNLLVGICIVIIRVIYHAQNLTFSYGVRSYEGSGSLLDNPGRPEDRDHAQMSIYAYARSSGCHFQEVLSHGPNGVFVTSW